LRRWAEQERREADLRALVEAARRADSQQAACSAPPTVH
jgi:hypothetical protein